MHGLQACLFKYITVAAFCFYLIVVKMPLKGEVGGHAFKSHGNYIVDHGKSWKNHGIVRVPTVREKSVKNEKSSRSGKSQGILS